MKVRVWEREAKTSRVVPVHPMYHQVVKEMVRQEEVRDGTRARQEEVRDSPVGGAWWREGNLHQVRESLSPKR